MISVVLVEPKWPSNVGAVARVMANFGFNKLLLIKPKCKLDDLDAIKRAKHAKHVLKKAKTITWNGLKKYDYVIATTSKLGSDYNLKRTPLNPEEISKKLNQKKKIAIVFGREGEGLHNEEIKKCDFVMTIPSAKKYPTLNLSHAVGIMLYELSKKKKGKIGENITLIGKKEKDNLLKIIYQTINKMKFNTIGKKQTQKLLWKRMISKSFLTKRESFALFGYFKKLK